jgi:SAM-dependent methyltransferase
MRLRYFKSDYLRRALRDSPLSRVDADVIPNVYLGGLKVWSCTADVVAATMALSRHRAASPTSAERAPSLDAHSRWIDSVAAALPPRRGASPAFVCADIGCGIGLIGTAAIQCGLARSVLFHDFNREIALACVASTLSLNVAPGTAAIVAGAFGDWDDFAPAATRFDLVLAADVTYDEPTAAKFVSLAERIVAPGGVVLVGTKVHYFGTGGGVDALLKHCTALQLVARSPLLGAGKEMSRCVVALKRSS